MSPRAPRQGWTPALALAVALTVGVGLWALAVVVLVRWMEHAR